MSGLSAGEGDTLYAVEDSFYKSNRFFTIDTSEYPAMITSATTLMDSNDVLSSISPNSIGPGVRFSFSKYNTKEDIDFTIAKLKTLY